MILPVPPQRPLRAVAGDYIADHRAPPIKESSTSTGGSVPPRPCARLALALARSAAHQHTQVYTRGAGRGGGEELA